MIGSNGGQCLGLAEFSGRNVRPILSIEQAEKAIEMFEPKGAEDCSGFIGKQKITASQQMQIVSMLLGSVFALGSLFTFSSTGFKVISFLLGCGLTVAAARAYRDDGKHERQRVVEIRRIITGVQNG